MSKRFCGVWATFEFLDDTCAAIRELKSAGFSKITTHAPCPRHEIAHALDDPQSKVPFATLAGAIFGFAVAVIIIIKMSLDWILPVSGKPVVSVPIMGPIVFEMSVLIAIFFTAASMAVFVLRDSWKHPVPGSSKYKKYNRFMRDRFGIVVACGQSDRRRIEEILQNHQAEEVNLEN